MELTFALLVTQAWRPAGRSVAPGHSATGSPFLYQVRFLPLATTVKVSRIGAAGGGSTAKNSVTAMSVVQVAPAPQASVGLVGGFSATVTGTQTAPPGPASSAVVISGLAESSPARVASPASPSRRQPPVSSPPAGRMTNDRI